MSEANIVTEDPEAGTVIYASEAVKEIVPAFDLKVGSIITVPTKAGTSDEFLIIGRLSEMSEAWGDYVMANSSNLGVRLGDRDFLIAGCDVDRGIAYRNKYLSIVHGRPEVELDPCSMMLQPAMFFEV